MAKTVNENVVNSDTSTFMGRVVIAFGGMPVTKIAKQIGVNHYTLRNYLRKQRDIPPDVLAHIGNSTGYSINWLLTGEGQRKISPSGTGFEFTGLERQLIQKLADESDLSFEKMLHELVLEALFKRGAELLANRTRIDTADLRSLQLLFKILPVEGGVEGGNEVERNEKQRAVK